MSGWRFNVKLAGRWVAFRNGETLTALRCANLVSPCHPGVLLLELAR